MFFWLLQWLSYRLLFPKFFSAQPMGSCFWKNILSASRYTLMKTHLCTLWLGLTICCINSTNKSDFGFELVLQFARKTNMNKNQTEKKICKKKRALQNDLSFVDKFLLYFWLITMGSSPLLIFIFLYCYASVLQILELYKQTSCEKFQQACLG